MHEALLFLVTIVWGSTFVVIKDAVTTINPFLIVFSRSLLAAISMFLIVFWRDRKSLENREVIFKGMMLGLLLAITYGSQTVGLRFTTSGHSGFITSTAVVFVPLILYFFYKQGISRWDMASIGLVMMGLYLLTYDVGTRVNIGDVITIITAVAYAAHVVLAGRFVQKKGVLALIAYQFIFAALFSFLAFVVSGDYGFQVTGKAVSAILYLGFVGTLFCYFVVVWAQKHVSSLKAVIIFSLESVFAALFGYLVFGELLTVKEFFGAALILGGVVFNQLQKKLVR